MSSNLSVNDEIEPHENDVLFGRGNNVNRHVGNLNFRQLCREHKAHYVMCTKLEKKSVSVNIVNHVRNMDPPGRFLRKNAEGQWVDVGDQEAREKTSQALRDCLPEGETAPDPNSIGNEVKKRNGPKGHSRKQTAPGRIQTNFMGGMYDFSSMMGPGVGSFVPSMVTPVVPPFNFNALNMNQLNTMGGFPMPTTNQVHPKTSPRTLNLGSSSMKATFTGISHSSTGLSPQTQNHRMNHPLISSAPSTSGTLSSQNYEQNGVSLAAQTTTSILSAKLSESHSQYRSPLPQCHDENENIAEDKSPSRSIRFYGDQSPGFQGVSIPTSSLASSREKRVHNRKRTAPGRIETDDLFAGLESYSDPFMPILVDGELLQTQNAIRHNTSAGDLVDQEHLFTLQDQNSLDPSFTRNRPRVVSDNSVSIGVRDTQRKYFNRGIPSTSSTNLNEDGKGLNDERLHSFKTNNGPIFDDLHAYQAERRRKRHVRKTTAPGRIQNDAMFLGIDEIDIRAISANDEVEWDLLNSFPLHKPNHSEQLEDDILSNFGKANDFLKFSTGASESISSSKRIHRRKTSTPGRMQHVFDIPNMPSNNFRRSPHQSGSDSIDSEMGFETQAFSSSRRKYFNRSYSDNTAHSSPANSKYFNRSCSAPDTSSEFNNEHTSFAIRDVFDNDAHHIPFSSDGLDFSKNAGLSSENFDMPDNNSKQMNVGSDELAWAETCNLLSSDNSFHEHTQSDVSTASCGIPSMGICTRTSTMDSIQEEAEEELGYFMRPQVPLPVVHERENSSCSSDILPLVHERENSSCSIELTSEDFLNLLRQN